MVLKTEDWVGRRFGKLVVIDLERSRGLGTAVVCKCDCGEEIRVKNYNLTAGTTQSCGCLWRKRMTTHGMTGTRVYRIWRQMHQRCINPKAEGYRNYGERGIKVCARWATFENFYEDMGDPPEGTTIDRINTNENYSPKNCKWSTWTEQHRNRRDNHLIVAFGETKCLTEWAEIKGLPVSTLKNRLYRAGMEPEEALTAPLYAKQRKI